MSPTGGVSRTGSIFRGYEILEKLGAGGEKKARTFTWDRHAELVEDMLVTMNQ